MEIIRQAELQTIKEYRFAVLPPKIGMNDEHTENTANNGQRKFDVQCQICGRMFAMTLSEMQNHFQSRSEEHNV